MQGDGDGGDGDGVTMRMWDNWVTGLHDKGMGGCGVTMMWT